MESKRNRSKNFSERDKMVLLEIISEYKEIVENKVTDAATNKLKQECWEKMCQKFNEQQNSGIRTAEQLRCLYDCLKRKARKEKVQIHEVVGGNSMGAAETVSDKVISLISKQVTSLSNETDSDATYHDTHFTSLEIIVPVTEGTVPVDEEETSTATGIQPSEVQETSTQHTNEKGRPKRTLNEVYEKVEDMATSQAKKNKKKIVQMCSVNDMKLKIHETELKMKEEELAARRRRYESEEEESSLRKEILKVELEIAKAKLDNEKHKFV